MIVLGQQAVINIFDMNIVQRGLVRATDLARQRLADNKACGECSRKCQLLNNFLLLTKMSGCRFTSALVNANFNV